MTSAQKAAWAAVQARLRQGGSVAAGVENLRQAGIAVRVVRLVLGNPGNPQFGQTADVSVAYGLTTPIANTRSGRGDSSRRCPHRH